MSVSLTWQDIALRLGLTVVAGMLIGFNRREHGRPAGMRTTMLVCLAAALAMIEANLLLSTSGRGSNAFATMDPMRLPLGILSGMGFIGAGAILRRDNVIVGLTTAATLWYVTVMGLLLGSGQIGLGLTALALGIGVLSGLNYVEGMMHEDSEATLVLECMSGGPSDDEIRSIIQASGGEIKAWGMAYSAGGKNREVWCEVIWRMKPRKTAPPGFVDAIGRHAGVASVSWEPRGIAYRARRPTL